jgi:ComF family protein
MCVCGNIVCKVNQYKSIEKFVMEIGFKFYRFTLDYQEICNLPCFLNPLKMSINKGLLDLFFPEHCLHCGDKTVVDNNIPLCFKCELKLDTAYTDGLQNPLIINRFKGILPIHLGFSLFYYSKAGVSQSLIHEAKYRGQTKLFVHYGKILGNRIKEEIASESVDLIVPIPNHWFKRIRIGYNQADIFAQALGKSLSMSVLDNALAKRFDLRSQTKRNKTQRLIHLQNLYRLGVSKNSIKGKHVLLIDDVITSGATVETCANLLLKAGARKISIASFMVVKS